MISCNKHLRQNRWFNFFHSELSIYMKQHSSSTCIWSIYISIDPIFQSLWFLSGYPLSHQHYGFDNIRSATICNYLQYMISCNIRLSTIYDQRQHMIIYNIRSVTIYDYLQYTTSNNIRLWWPCLLMDLDKMRIRYRGPSIDASYQVSIHMVERFQRRRLKCEKLTDDNWHGRSQELLDRISWNLVEL
jgi:hypothetical protein